MNRIVLCIVAAAAVSTWTACVVSDREPRQAAAPRVQENAPAHAVEPAQPVRNDVAAPVPVPQEPIPEGLSSEERRDIDVFRGASAAVVYITSIAVQQDFWSLNVYEIPQGTGSGFIWDRNGHVVTNFHVVAEGEKFTVTLADKTTWDAEVVGRAPQKDLAVLRIKAPAAKLVPLPLGNSSNLLVGQHVLAIGNPFGLDHTLTVGIVSALGRDLTSPNGRRIKDVIQTDAAINPGNSGGPLLDSSGRLIGVNAAIYSPSGASAGIGFAVPVDTVKRLVPQMIERGTPTQPGIGINVLPSERAGDIRGIVVLQVARGGPAAAAGLEGVRRTRGGIMLGDVIVAVDGHPVRTLDDMQDLFDAAGVGKSVRLTVTREGRQRDATVTLRDLSGEQ